MKTTLHHFADESPWSQHRLVWKEDDKRVSSETGLEGPEIVEDKDSQDTLMDKVGGVYTTKNPQDFIDKFSFLTELEGQESLSDLFSEISETNDITTAQKQKIMEVLFERLSKITSSSTLHSLDKLQRKPLGADEDVLDVAKEALESIVAAAESREQDGNEGRYYRHLADTIESMGLKKDELMRTADLTEREQLLQDEHRNTTTKLQLLQKQIDHVKQLEEKVAKEKPKLEKWMRRGKWILGGALLGAGTAGLAMIPALAVPAFAIESTAGLIGLHMGGFSALGVAARALKEWRKGSGFEKRIEKKAALQKSIRYQKELLEKGKITISSGKMITEFILPKAVRLRKGALIDGREVTADTEVAPRGTTVTGKVHKTVTFELPTLEVKEEDKGKTYKEKLESIQAKQQEELTTVTTMLGEHNGRISTMKSSFDADYNKLVAKVQKNEEAVTRASQELGIADLRLKKAPTDKITERQAELDIAQKRFKANQEELDRSQDALKEMDRVNRVFMLNEDFAKVPVSPEVLDALYRQTVNPEAFELMVAIQRGIVDRTKKAQLTLGRMEKDKLRELCIGVDEITKKEISDYIEKDKLRSIRGLNQTSLEARNPVLRKLKRRSRELYEFCLALGTVSPDTRYAENKEGKSPDVMLREILGEVGAEQGDEDKKDSKAPEKTEDEKEDDTSKEPEKTGEKVKESAVTEALLKAGHMKEVIVGEVHLKGIKQQIYDSAKCGTLMKRVLDKKPDLAPQGNPDFFEGKTLREAMRKLKDSKDLEGIQKTQALFEFIRDECVMSPLQLGHIDPSHSGLIANEEENLLFTKEEIKENILKDIEKIKGIISPDISSLPDSPSGEFFHQLIKDITTPFIPDVSIAGIPNEKLARRAANLEAVARAIESGDIILQPDTFALKEKEKKIVFYVGSMDDEVKAVDIKRDVASGEHARIVDYK